MGIHERERAEIVAAADEGKLPAWMRDRLLSILGRLAALEEWAYPLVERRTAQETNAILSAECLKLRAELTKTRGQRDALLHTAQTLLKHAPIANDFGDRSVYMQAKRALQTAVDGVVLMQESGEGEGE